MHYCSAKLSQLRRNIVLQFMLAFATGQGAAKARLKFKEEEEFEMLELNRIHPSQAKEKEETFSEAKIGAL